MWGNGGKGKDTEHTVDRERVRKINMQEREEKRKEGIDLSVYDKRTRILRCVTTGRGGKNGEQTVDRVRVRKISMRVREIKKIINKKKE